MVELDEQTKTPALVLSADRLEASNPNWTFESVHATLCVGRGMSTVPPYPAGWYYEVTLKCTGILQIGTYFRYCSSSPLEHFIFVLFLFCFCFFCFLHWRNLYLLNSIGDLFSKKCILPLKAGKPKNADTVPSEALGLVTTKTRVHSMVRGVKYGVDPLVNN